MCLKYKSFRQGNEGNVLKLKLIYLKIKKLKSAHCRVPYFWKANASHHRVRLFYDTMHFKMQTLSIVFYPLTSSKVVERTNSASTNAIV